MKFLNHVCSFCFLVILFVSFAGSSYGQDKRSDAGMNSFRKWVERNYHVSRAMRKADVYGWVKVNFTVDTTGMLTDLSIVEDLGHGTGEELMRVLDLSNRKRGPWRPGMKDGKKVRVIYTFPVFVDAR